MIVFSKSLSGLATANLGKGVAYSVSDLKKIRDTLSVSPSISGTDMIVFTVKDISGAFAGNDVKAIKTRDPKIVALCLYKTSEQKTVQKMKETLTNVDFVSVGKTYTGEAFLAAVEKAVEGLDISTKPQKEFTPDDVMDPMLGSMQTEVAAKKKEEPVAEVDPFVEQPFQKPEPVHERVVPEPTVVPAEAPGLDMEKLMYRDTRPEPPAEKSEDSIEYRLQRGFSSIEGLKSIVSSEAIALQLIKENNVYVNAVTQLDILEKELERVYLNVNLSAEEIFLKVKEIGELRASYKAQANNELIKKSMDIINLVVDQTEKQKNLEISGLQEALGRIKVSDEQFTKDIDELSILRNSQIDISNSVMKARNDLLGVQEVISDLANEVKMEMINGLPSTVDAINERFSMMANSFRPNNLVELTNEINTTIRQNIDRFSFIESKLSTLLNLIVELVTVDSEIIQAQDKLLKRLFVNRVEETVVASNPIKGTLRIYFADKGATDTIMSIAGVESRVKNCLTIDTVAKPHAYAKYGVKTYDSILKVDNQDLAFCVTDEEFDVIFESLESLTSHYGIINLVISQDNAAFVKSFAEQSLSLTFVTDCSIESIENTKEVYDNMKSLNNIARRVLLIDPPSRVIDVVTRITENVNSLKVISIPTFTEYKEHALLRTAPWSSLKINKTIQSALGM